MGREKKFTAYIKSTLSQTFWILKNLEEEIVEDQLDQTRELEELDFYASFSMDRNGGEYV